MRRLLLLFILSPVILFGQVRQKALADSIKAVGTDIREISEAINNSPGNKVENIHVSDSAGYVTVLVRVHVAEASVIPRLPPLPFANIKTADIVVDGVGTVEVPPRCRLVLEPDTVIALSPRPVVKLNTGDILVANADPVIVPPRSRLVLEPDTVIALSARAFVKFNTRDIPVAKIETAAVPSLPYIKPWIDTLPLLSVTLLKMKAVVAGRLSATAIPPLADVEKEVMEPLDPSEPLQLAIKRTRPGKMKTCTVPVFEVTRMEVSEMHLSDEGYELLEKLEGFSPQLYALGDGGLTIGFGFFVPYSESSKWDKGISWEAAERMIREKVPSYEDQVKQYINVPLTQLEFDALTMLAYNLGGFSKATSIVNDINSNADFEKLQKDWMRFVHSKAPGVLKGLMNRRRDEMQVRNEWNYQPERKIQILKNR